MPWMRERDGTHGHGRDGAVEREQQRWVRGLVVRVRRKRQLVGDPNGKLEWQRQWWQQQLRVGREQLLEQRRQ